MGNGNGSVPPKALPLTCPGCIVNGSESELLLFHFIVGWLFQAYLLRVFFDKWPC
jgi:hypothetical protein